jgi:hypothetical protein
LQWARNLAMDGRRVVFACYEHDEATLLGRLLRLELGGLPTSDRLSERGRSARATLSRLDAGEISLGEAIVEAPILREPQARLRDYADRLWLVRASGASTTLEELGKLIDTDTDALFVDYIQKVPVTDDRADEKERITVVAQGLKELAMSADVAVVAVAAAKSGSPRPRAAWLAAWSSSGFPATKCWRIAN